MTKLKIKKYILDNDISITELAQKLGITKQALSHRIMQDSVNSNTLFDIADAIGCPVSDLLDDERQAKRKRIEDDALFCAVRFRGRYYTASTVDELTYIVDLIKEMDTQP